MTKERIIVEVHFGIEREKPSVSSRNEGIDLNQRGVRIQESLVETGQEVHGGIDLLRFQAQVEGDLPCLKGFEPQAGINVLLQGGVAIFPRNLLGIHSSSPRTHKNRLAPGAIDQKSQN